MPDHEISKERKGRLGVRSLSALRSRN
jgi:hypothetical protein